MLPSTIEGAVARAVECRRLLDHPYYVKWQAGALSSEDLACYAGQYRHFERLLPEVLAAISRTVDAGPARWLTESNLRDERSFPEPHLDLFDRFAAAVGASTADSPFPATRKLVNLYRTSAAAGPVPALAVIAGYEVQAAEIAATKADALRLHHGLSDDQTQFWDVHARIERTHAVWTTEALHLLGAHSDTVEQWAARSATAWWTFLDQQDAVIFN